MVPLIAEEGQHSHAESSAGSTTIGDAAVHRSQRAERISHPEA